MLTVSYIDVSKLATLAITTMQENPKLSEYLYFLFTTLITLRLELSRFALQCMAIFGHESKGLSSPGSPVSLPFTEASTLSPSLSAMAIGSDDATDPIPTPTPDEFERISYYNGITGNHEHPLLLYRSDFETKLFPKPRGRFFNLPVKSVYGVYDTPLNIVWDTVGPAILNLVKARTKDWTSVDPARFFTHVSPGEEGKGSLGPVVIWVGVRPGSTSSDTAHEVSQEILGLLETNGVPDAVVEWREAVPQRLARLPLMGHVGSDDPTHQFRRLLSPLLGVPLAAGDLEDDDAQGTLTLWFHENKDKKGEPSDKVFGVSNCHVLRKDTTVDWEHKGGAAPNHVRVCGGRRFQAGLEDIAKAISDHGILAAQWAREIKRLQQKEQDKKTIKSIDRTQSKLDEENEAVADLELLHAEFTLEWSNLKLHRNIGQVRVAKRITVDVKGGTRYTSDWAAFSADESKVRKEFEGNTVDLGAF